MFRKIGRFCTVVGGVLFRVGLFANIFLLFLVLGTLARQELSYHLRYNNAYLQIEREHERQMSVAAIIQSQNAWFGQAELMKFQFLEQKAATNQLAIQLQVVNNEYYHLLKTLQETDLEAYNKVVEQLNKAPDEPPPLFFNEPTPADPATRPERKDNEA